MFKVIFVSEISEKTIEAEMKFIPRVGDVIPVLYKPFPQVTKIILPIKEGFSNVAYSEFDAVCLVQ